MKFDIFMQKTANLAAENRLLKFFIVVIGITVVINTAVTIRAFRMQKIILVPPIVDSRIEIAGDKASDGYVKTFVRYISALAFNYTPATARLQFGELLATYAPPAYPSAKKTFYDLADTIEMSHVTNSFVIQKIDIDSEKHQIDVLGNNLRYSEDRKVEESQRTYLIQYRIENGKFMITELKEKEK